MNILFLVLEPPYPPNDGGRIRTYNILKWVSQTHTVTLLSGSNSDIDNGAIKELERYCQKIIITPSPSSQPRSNSRKIKDLGRRYPVALDQYASLNMTDEIKKIVVSGEFDMVHVNHTCLAQHIDHLKDLPAVLVHENIETLVQRRELWNRTDRFSLRWWGYWLEYYRWLRYEIEYSKQFDTLITVSEEEAHYFKTRVPEVPIVIVPNGVDTNFFTPVNKSANPAALLYAGSMNYEPNVDAMVWFCKEILHLIQDPHPEATLTIVGRDPAPEVVALAELPGVTVTGMVPDVRPYYGSASIYVVPLRQGGGTRLKILEAMAMEMPIVSTSIGSEGLNLTPGEDIINADAPADFAHQVNRLIKDGEARDKLSRRARQTVVRRYDWGAIAKKQQRAYEIAIEKHNQGRV